MNTYQTLCNLIDDLILNQGEFGIDGYSLHYQDLDESDQQSIAAAFIEYDERDLFSITENEKYDDIVSSLLTMLKKDTQESAEDFSNGIKARLREYYAKRAQELINERCVDIKSEQAWANRRVTRQNRTTGEFHTSHI